MSSTSVSVFHPYDDRRPICSMPYHKAKELVLQGLAGWINRCKGIRLTSFLTNALRGRSCNISASTIQKYVELLGTKRCAGLAAAINSWQFRAPIKKVPRLSDLPVSDWNANWNHPEIVDIEALDHA